MAQGRSSAIILAAAVMVLTVVVFQGRVAEAATYTVGDDGWTFFTSGWPQGKRFVAGDVLVFKYNPRIHNVVQVNRAGYDGCTTTPGAKVYQSGNDQISLVKGPNFFICSIPGHCEGRMKIAVNAV